MTDHGFTEGRTECANHPGVNARGICWVCGKPVCGNCLVYVDTLAVCDDAVHKTVLSNWTTVYRCNSEFEAEMITKNLAFQRVETKVFSSRAFKLAIGENPNDFVNVFVPRDEIGRATDALQTLGLLNAVETVNVI